MQMSILTLVLVLSFGVGLAASLKVWPVSCSGAAPKDLGRRERCTWAGWTADAYRVDGDLVRAVEQMSALGGEATVTLCSLARGECPTCREGQVEAGQALVADLGLICSEPTTP